MLRGAQTPGELRQRTERLQQFATIDELEALLNALAQRRLIIRFERRPGQKEARWSLGSGFGVLDTTDAATPERQGWPPPATALPSSPGVLDDGLETRVATLERELRALRDVVAQLRARVD
jgi:hypothetical protein